jgi:uncharacterized protein YyaL (SSP411 family)
MPQSAITLLMACMLSLFTISLDGLAASPQDNPMNDEQLRSAYLAKGSDYRPRTEHLNADGSPRFINHLILEDSPYLLQHAHNPVNWQPWGEAAFLQARRENKPIFLSIGYSTCHWCHVMERESFENLDIAGILNEHFIAIKVDRETRPDIDETYMSAVTIMTGQGGWPMSSFLTPEGKPFFGGTYYPPESFARLLQRVHDLWRDERAALVAQADQLSQAVEQANARGNAPQALADDALDKAIGAILRRFDNMQGGFSQAPKFPHEPLLMLLLNQLERKALPAGREALETSLDAMARGGIYDQIGGGFHRYSTDNDWLVPHFEKMLYNQAHLARIYLQAWRLNGSHQSRRIATETLDYVLREMTDAQGRFYSATDADSEGGEGSYFVWTPAQIEQLLSGEDAAWVTALYGLSQAGNFEGSNILHLPESLEAYAQAHNRPLAEVESRLARIKQRLRQARAKRPAPLRDDKIITAWNGMMISALAQAGLLLDRPDYRAAALSAANALWQSNRREDGRLWRIHLRGHSSVDAGLEDYAFLAEGLLHLYDLTADAVWLERAASLAQQTIRRFADGHGGFYMSEAGIEHIALARPLDAGADGAIPATSGVMLQVLQMLWRRSGEQAYRQQAEALINTFAASIAESPHAFSTLLGANANLEQGETGSIGYAGKGGIRLQARVQADNSLVLSIRMADGMHINGHRVSDTQTHNTRMSIDSPDWRLLSMDYPREDSLQLDPQAEPIRIYRHNLDIHGQLQQRNNQTDHRLIPLQVSLQACTDNICLPPETIVLRPSTAR